MIYFLDLKPDKQLRLMKYYVNLQYKFDSIILRKKINYIEKYVRHIDLYTLHKCDKCNSFGIISNTASVVDILSKRAWKFLNYRILCYKCYV